MCLYRCTEDGSTLQSSSECVSSNTPKMIGGDTLSGGGNELEHNVHSTRYKTEQVCHFKGSNNYSPLITLLYN